MIKPDGFREIIKVFRSFQLKENKFAYFVWRNNTVENHHSEYFTILLVNKKMLYERKKTIQSNHF